MLLIILVLCVICPGGFTANVHTVFPESRDDSKPVDRDEYGVRNHLSDHELPRDVPTRVQIVGDLGTPPPTVKLDFMPKQTYVQVRRYDAVKRLPQEAAMEEAATSEEMANAPRLREVVTHKKTQEVYEEQGYEDAGYDHGGSKKLKIEEEIKDNQSVEVYGPSNSSAQSTDETKDNVELVAPSGRGTWSRHKTTTGKKTKYEEDGDKRKITTNDSDPVSEKTSGNYTKFDGGKTIVVQNITETAKKDLKKDVAESRRVASFSKTRNNVEPTTYRPTVRHDNSSRHGQKQTMINEQKRNRTRNRPPKKRQEADEQKSQTDIVGSYDHSPWVPISPPTDYNKNKPQTESNNSVKSKIHSDLYESNGHSTKYGYTVSHDTPYKYVFPTNLFAPESLNKPNRKLRSKPKNSDVISGKPKASPFVNYGYIPQTNYDGSAINPKPKKLKKEEDLSFDNTNLALSDKHKQPVLQFKTHFTHNIQHDGSAINQRQKNKSVQVGSLEHLNSNSKQPYRVQKTKGSRDVETELGNYGNFDSRYTGTIAQDFGPPKIYNAPFITRLKKNNYNVDSRGDLSLRVYPKYEFYPHHQNAKHSINDENYNGQIPLSNLNKGNSNIELKESPPRSTKRENTRLSEYSKFNNRPQSIHKQPLKPIKSSESLEYYPKLRNKSAELSGEKYSRFNSGDTYPKFELNNRYENTANTKSSPTFRLIPYKKTVKINNPYSYVNHDDHYASGSRISGVGIKIEATTQSSKLNNKAVYWNNRHPHLPKDSIKNNVDEHRGKSEEQNTRHVENLTLAHFAGLRKSGSYRPLPLEYNERVNNLAKLLNDNYPKRTRRRRDLEVIHIASSGTTTEIPVDTIVYPHYKKAPKESALRYATNPILAPRKTAGGMEFYASTDSVKCNDMSAPTDIVPERTVDGEWKGEPSSNGPRVNDLGEQIRCFKKKYFGSDPLDNPIFKEKDVGFPDVLFSMKKPLNNKKPGTQSGKPHVNWNFADELIPGNWFPDKDKRKRRSDNNSLPMNHKIQGMESLIPEPVILKFPTTATTVVYNNETKLDTDNIDSDVSSNDEHILQYSVKHPAQKLKSVTRINNSMDDKIVGLIPPPQTKKKKIKFKKTKKPLVKQVLKKVKLNDHSNEDDLLDVLNPITSFFTDEDDVMTGPIIHNFFNIKMTPSTKLKSITLFDKNSGDKVNKFQMKNYRRIKRNMEGVELQKPKQRKLNVNNNANVSLSSPTARVRMYSPKNGTFFREKRDYVSVNVDIRRKEPRYYYQTERPQARVKRVVHNPPFFSRRSRVFSSKYLIADQDNSETLPEEINVAFFTTPKPIYPSTPKFIPAIAFGDSKTKIVNYNDSVANSTNDNERTQYDKKGSLIYVINPDNGLGKWMKVIKVKNEDDTKSALTNGPVYLESKIKESASEQSVGKFGFKGSAKNLFKNVLGPTIDNRFQFKFPNNEQVKKEVIEKPKVDCPKLIRPKKNEIKRRTTTTSTTEIPVIEEDVEDRPEEQLSEEEETQPPPHQEDGEEGENEEEQPTERPVVERPSRPNRYYHHESEENPDNTENEDQEIHESNRKIPYVSVKKPKFTGRYYRGSSDKHAK